MAKGDDTVLKKRNKAIRKRARRAGADTPEAVQATEAHRRRRKLGTRRVCESMCYSLPTPEDPFNERGSRKNKKKSDRGATSPAKGTIASKRKRNEEAQEMPDEAVRSKKRRKVEDMIGDLKGFVQAKTDGSKQAGKLAGSVASSEVKARSNGHVLGKVVWQATTQKPASDGKLADLKGERAAELAFQICLHGILPGNPSANGGSAGEKAKVGGKVERQCWTGCGRGLDVLVPCDLPNEKRSLAYVPPIAAHIAGRRLPGTEKPAALVLVPSQERVMEVRQALKPLKKLLQVSCVGLHTGTSVERQMEGLGSQSADIIAATPDRLCELFALEAVKLGRISFVVLDALDEMLAQGFEDQLIRIEANVHSSRQVVILSKSFPGNVVRIIRLLMKEPLLRVTSDTSMALQSACVTQSASVVVNDIKRLEKFGKILQEVQRRDEQTKSGPRILVVVKNSEKVHNVFASVVQTGLNVEDLTASQDQQELSDLQVVKNFKQGRVQVLVLTEGMISRFPFKAIHVANVIFYDFPTSLSAYCVVLTRMAKDSVSGRIYSICSGAMAPLAGQLVEVLQQCWQPVPAALEMLVKAVVTITSERKAGDAA